MRKAVPGGLLPFGTTVLVEIPFEDAPGVAKLRPAMVISHSAATASILVAPISRSHRRSLRTGWFGLYADDLGGRLLRDASLRAESAVDLNRLIRVPIGLPHFHGVLGFISFDDKTIGRRLVSAARETPNLAVIMKAVLAY